VYAKGFEVIFLSQYNRNAAYDFSKTKVHKERKVIDIRYSRARRAREFRLKVTAGLCVVGFVLSLVTGVFLFLVGQVKLAELTARVTEVTKQLREIESQNHKERPNKEISKSRSAEFDKAEILK
jgi:uncharacterized membrane protein YciS (DUF1049 family)